MILEMGIGLTASWSWSWSLDSSELVSLLWIERLVFRLRIRFDLLRLFGEHVIKRATSSLPSSLSVENAASFVFEILLLRSWRLYWDFRLCALCIKIGGLGSVKYNMVKGKCFDTTKLSNLIFYNWNWTV